jgi:parvulin-like peptidyl-prolyl isomerase
LAAAERLEVGELSPPVRSGVGIHLLELVDRTPAISPPFDEVAAQVAVEWRRRTGDRALRAYLDELRADGDVVVRLPQID